ncbi:ribosomal-processing cysteine protease Prp [Terrilactibacillus sp. BCM23-1]|uniref:Ribosomal processing cysteine protease Prp n=1 Tax=Terrilactibacillus tamarindi TaxID=2599694 RepID=A0A6N8CRZ3_9BACI|nr:ribosomal-processing cysteine protease Prp [Terrilactibacillus tamarindi]MTT32418.1 ribosomal-processing cysteine protease Prp [Terrilactibacillus tamarindi]
MIKVDIKRNHTGDILSFTIKGHADSGPYGYDLVCAGVSAVSFGSLNAIEALTGITPDIQDTENGGFLSCHFPEDIDQDAWMKVQLLLEGMIVSLKTIEESYGQHIQIHS